ncbi:sulfotransferase family 2 domain-containing protein [Paraglaciecola marina]|uniref:sulfotransferase family 2 domain-containing protein n=1 Tax=Paraglaciecola marina TaxID=2500157 RepID=UPI00105F3419|nr:sulfotransferase family 2 domain-containing protein [Paraglaciecola marina]
MPIKPDSKLIFIHVPKTGGSSIEKELGLHPSDVVDSDYFLSGGKKQKQHLTLAEILSIKKDDFDLSKFTAIGMVRNPINRMVSEYKWRKKINHNVINDLDINTFVKKIFDAKKQGAKLDSHFTPQSDFFKLGSQSALKEIKIFKFEDGFDKVSRYLSLYLKCSDFKIGKVNHTDQIKLDCELHSESESLIKEMYEEDFEKFYREEYEL